MAVTRHRSVPRVAAALLSLLALTGCSFFHAAGMVDASGRGQPLQIVSDPTGAEVYINGRPLGETPAIVRVHSSIGSSFRLQILKAGYEPVEVVIDAEGLAPGLFEYDQQYTFELRPAVR